MKKKVLLLTGILLLSLATVVSAAAVWGQYKGYDIIRITVDGKTVKPTDAPAIKFNGRTMVPIYMLQQAGVKYTWDDKNKTVAVESYQPEVSYSLKDISSSVEQAGVTSVNLISNSKVAIITFLYNGPMNKLDADSTSFNDILYASTFADAELTKILFNDNAEFSVPTAALRDFYDEKLTTDQLSSFYSIKEPVVIEKPAPTNQKICTDINAYYDQQAQSIRDFENRRGGTYSGGLQYQLDMNEQNRKKELQQSGC